MPKPPKNAAGSLARILMITSHDPIAPDRKVANI
jgi:hypothetical protein